MQDMIQALPSEFYQKILLLLALLKLNYFKRWISFIIHIPKETIGLLYQIPLLLNLFWPLILQNQKKKNLGYRKLPLLWVCFPFLSKSNYLISYPYQSLFKTWRHVLWEVFFRFMSIPPVQEEHYKPALHLIFIPEYYGWWNTQPYIERDLCHSGRIRGRILATQI